MRRRVLTATISALAVAVVLLGIPLAIAAAQLVREDAIRDLELRTTTASRALELRELSGQQVTPEVLEFYVTGAPGTPSYIYVRLADGSEVEAGTRPAPAFSDNHVTDSGLVVYMYVSWWEVFWQSARAVGLVVALSVVAVLAGIMMAIWQANRLSAPLVYLAASAEQLGAGQVRPRLESTGIEEIDLVAEELARSADRMADRLAVERQFASDASHQLRTPLTALSMRLEEISATTTRDDVKHEAERALEQVERLVGVVDDLLGRSRKALGSQTEVVTLEDVFQQQRQEWGPTFAKARRTLVIEPTPVRVVASSGGLAQVLATLIENSLKHGGGTTTVTARESGTTNAVVIAVGDEGTGVPEELAPRIFEREVTGGKGTGLGLALARDLVTADGGRLELSKRVPAEFSIFLQAVPHMVDLDTVVPHARAVKPRRGSRRR